MCVCQKVYGFKIVKIKVQKETNTTIGNNQLHVKQKTKTKNKNKIGAFVRAPATGSK